MSTNSSSVPVLTPIPDADLQTVMGAVKVLQDVLLPYLHELSVDERRKLPKMGPKTVDFVTRTLSYVQANPQFVPPYASLTDYAAGVASADTLRSVLQPLSLIARVLDDTLMLTGSVAYSATLTCYQSIKQAARRHEFNAEKIYADLSPRFPGRRTKLAVAALLAASAAPAAGTAA